MSCSANQFTTMTPTPATVPGRNDQRGCTAHAQQANTAQHCRGSKHFETSIYASPWPTERRINDTAHATTLVAEATAASSCVRYSVAASRDAHYPHTKHRTKIHSLPCKRGHRPHAVAPRRARHANEKRKHNNSPCERTQRWHAHAETETAATATTKTTYKTQNATRYRSGHDSSTCTTPTRSDRKSRPRRRDGVTTGTHHTHRNTQLVTRQPPSAPASTLRSYSGLITA
jgi:hypothetical protein